MANCTVGKKGPFNCLCYGIQQEPGIHKCISSYCMFLQMMYTNVGEIDEKIATK